MLRARLSSIYRHLRTMSTDTTGKYFPKTVEIPQTDESLRLNHTCLRIKDPKITIPFYQEKFGMELLYHKQFPEMKFDLYFLAFPGKGSTKNEQGFPDVFRESGILELTHNYGTENDPEFTVNNGNEEPHRGFGHICFSITDLESECSRLEAAGVAFKKRLSDGRQKNIAFALDPDGYWIELIGHEPVAGHQSDYKFNHTMIRVKDPVKSLEFYQNVLGMKLASRHKRTPRCQIHFILPWLRQQPEGPHPRPQRGHPGIDPQLGHRNARCVCLPHRKHPTPRLRPHLHLQQQGR